MVWMNVYGAPSARELIESSVATTMNANPELATTWKGRILVHFAVDDTESPESKTVKLMDEAKKAFYEKPMVMSALAWKRYEIIAEVGSGVNLPEDKKYKVRLQIGAFKNEKDVDYCETTEEPKETYHRFNRWSQRFEAKVINTRY